MKKMSIQRKIQRELIRSNREKHLNPEAIDACQENGKIRVCFKSGDQIMSIREFEKWCNTHNVIVKANKKKATAELIYPLMCRKKGSEDKSPAEVLYIVWDHLQCKKFGTAIRENNVAKASKPARCWRNRIAGISRRSVKA